MGLEDVRIGMRVRYVHTTYCTDGTMTETVKTPVYTVTGINDYGDVEYTVKGGKSWACHPSHLRPAD